ncbi:MAG: PorV/PorQ family protein [Ignavibacteriales bacterium]|nr:PorV/PorQ family protein [Ignavibacteriales bacterium]
MLKRHSVLSSILLLIIFLFSFISQPNAQTVIGKYAGEFMAIGVGGRANGMGGAYVAVANDVTSGYWNPAGLASINYPQISLMHEEHFGNLVNYNYGSVALPYGSDMSFGLSIIRLGIDGIPDTREALIDRESKVVIYDIGNPRAGIDPSKIKEFNNSDWAFYLTFAKKYSENFSYGANVKFILRDIAEYSAYGVGFDIGAMYMPYEKFYIGANVQDITTTLVAWNTGRNELITPTLKLGTAYLLDLSFGRFTPAVDFDIRFENRRFASQFNLGPVSFDPHFGLEYSFKNVVSVRFGYNDVKQFTLGAGVKLPKLNIDYSFSRFNMSSDERLPDSHRISLILTLEEPKFLRSSN